MATKNENEATEVVKKDASKQVVPSETKSETEQLIYIGPSIREDGVGVRTNQVFVGGVPTHLKPLYDKYPLFKTLFVPVTKLQESNKKINQTGTALNAAARSLKGE